MEIRLGSYVVSPRLIGSLMHRRAESVEGAAALLQALGIHRHPQVRPLRGGGTFLQANLYLGTLLPGGRCERVAFMAFEPSRVSVGNPCVYSGSEESDYALRLYVLEGGVQVLRLHHSGPTEDQLRWSRNPVTYGPGAISFRFTQFAVVILHETGGFCTGDQFVMPRQQAERLDQPARRGRPTGRPSLPRYDAAARKWDGLRDPWRDFGGGNII